MKPCTLPKMPGVTALLFTRKNPLVNLPQVAETNTPRPMDAAGECSLYDEFVMRSQTRVSQPFT